MVMCKGYGSQFTNFSETTFQNKNVAMASFLFIWQHIYIFGINLGKGVRSIQQNKVTTKYHIMINIKMLIFNGL